LLAFGRDLEAAQPGERSRAGYAQVRGQSEALTAPLEIEDYGVQPMDDASPPKWHLAHTSWFFETFLLRPFLEGYEPCHPAYEHLFNSYYNGVGQPFPRPRRGHLSRPTVAEVMEYRRYVDEAMMRLLDAIFAAELPEEARSEVIRRTTLGLHHEQQHQELLITDLKYNFGHNPLAPVYSAPLSGLTAAPDAEDGGLGFTSYAGGLVEIGVDPQAEAHAFHFDNESPAHPVYIAPYSLANRVVTCAEYLAFMADGGYRTPSLWLSDGWAWVNEAGIEAPLYWTRREDEWWEYRLAGAAPVEDRLPVTHVSAYEADAFARWAGYRLPTEAEWEAAATAAPVTGNFADSGRFHPATAGTKGSPQQLFGDVWEWTASAYGPYPGYTAPAGTIGEYNGKFMANQLVLKGGSCATPADHIRRSYRNFFYPPDRWQFTGIRLAKDDH
jgi:ergothioneine biosynthesis protein EgtB